MVKKNKEIVGVAVSSDGRSAGASPPSPSVSAVPAAAANAKVWRITSYVPSHRMFDLSPDLTPEQITKATRSEPVNPGHHKSTLQWTFYAERYIEGADGQMVAVCFPCCIWDYYDARWSAYGPADAFRAIGLLPPVKAEGR